MGHIWAAMTTSEVCFVESVRPFKWHWPTQVIGMKTTAATGGVQVCEVLTEMRPQLTLIFCRSIVDQFLGLSGFYCTAPVGEVHGGYPQNAPKWMVYIGKSH